MWELLTLFLTNSIIAFFVFLALIKIATMMNVDFNLWLLDQLENMRDALEEKQQKLEQEQKAQSKEEEEENQK